MGCMNRLLAVYENVHQDTSNALCESLGFLGPRKMYHNKDMETTRGKAKTVAKATGGGAALGAIMGHTAGELAGMAATNKAHGISKVAGLAADKLTHKIAMTGMKGGAVLGAGLGVMGGIKQIHDFKKSREKAEKIIAGEKDSEEWNRKEKSKLAGGKKRDGDGDGILNESVRLPAFRICREYGNQFVPSKPEHKDCPKCRKLSESTRIQEGIADWLGLSQKSKDEKKEKTKAKVGSGFLSAVHQFDQVTDHHPLPQKIVDKWLEELSKEFEKGQMKDWTDGHNHFADSFNDWIRTPEGIKWNETQAAKFNKNKDKK